MFGRRRKRKSKCLDRREVEVNIITSNMNTLSEGSNIYEQPLLLSNYFAMHMARHTGQTVTIFVSAGGIAGAGFTGVLLFVCEAYIKLLTQIGPPPACSLGNSCGFPAYGLINVNHRNTQVGRNGYMSVLGSITYIPLNKIVAFVHNSK
jgi:hypothetical protein